MVGEPKAIVSPIVHMVVRLVGTRSSNGTAVGSARRQGLSGPTMRHRSSMADEDAWYDRNRQILETAYLAGDTPQQQSGFNGDAAHWKRLRQVIADAIDHDGTILDVGCANGLLMETLVT